MSTYSDSCSEDEDFDIDWTYELFNNKYLLLKKLGKGSYCSVWLSYEFESNKFYALKIYNRYDFKRGKKELSVFDNIKSKKICGVITYNKCFNFIHEDYDEEFAYDSSEDAKYHKIFLCAEMELGGYSLYDVIKLFKDTKYTIPEDYNVVVINNIITALNDIHKNGLVHSDIKPENIILRKPSYETYMIMTQIQQLRKGVFAKLNRKNIKEFIKKLKPVLLNNDDYSLEDKYNYIFDGKYDIYVCDMGTAIKANDPALYKKFTIYYRAPETILKLPYTHTYDYWSLGCTIYEMLTGNLLFDVNDDLELLYNIISKFGPLPETMIEQSPYKKKFFSTNLRLKGYKKIYFSKISDGFTNKTITPQIEKIIRLMINMLNINPSERRALSI